MDEIEGRIAVIHQGDFEILLIAATVQATGRTSRVQVRGSMWIIRCLSRVPSRELQLFISSP